MSFTQIDEKAIQLAKHIRSHFLENDLLEESVINSLYIAGGFYQRIHSNTLKYGDVDIFCSDKCYENMMFKYMQQSRHWSKSHASATWLRPIPWGNSKNLLLQYIGRECFVGEPEIIMEGFDMVHTQVSIKLSNPENIIFIDKEVTQKAISNRRIVLTHWRKKTNSASTPKRVCKLVSQNWCMEEGTWEALTPNSENNWDDTGY